MIERASCEDACTATGTLNTTTDRAHEVGVDPPAVTVVGDVVAVRDRVSEYPRAA